MAPDVGFEPTTKRLTAAYSTAELIWNIAQKRNKIIIDFFYNVKRIVVFFKKHTNFYCKVWLLGGKIP